MLPSRAADAAWLCKAIATIRNIQLAIRRSCLRMVGVLLTFGVAAKRKQGIFLRVVAAFGPGREGEGQNAVEMIRDDGYRYHTQATALTASEA